MPTTYYHTLNGELLGETGPGGRRFYGKDALGSVVATYDQNGTLENTYRYKPYGGLLSKTGSAPDPRFMWTGSTGSRTTGANYAEQYNRARHYGSMQAGWTSVDPLWPRQESYAYAHSSPLLLSDPSGMVPPMCPCFVVYRKQFKYRIGCVRSQVDIVDSGEACFTRIGEKVVDCQADCCSTLNPDATNCESKRLCSGVLRQVYKFTQTKRVDGRYDLSSECPRTTHDTGCPQGPDRLFYKDFLAAIPKYGDIAAGLVSLVDASPTRMSQYKNSFKRKALQARPPHLCELSGRG